MDSTFEQFIVDRRKNDLTEIMKYEDKLYCYSFVRRLGVQTPKVLWIGDVQDLPTLDTLSSNVVIKPVSMSDAQGVFLLKNGRSAFDDNTKYTQQQIINGIVDTPFMTPVKIPTMAEEFLESYHEGDIIPRDYKFYCNGDNVFMVCVVCRTTKIVADSLKNSHYSLDVNFEPLPETVVEGYPFSLDVPEKPSYWDTMVDHVKRIGREVGYFVRIDMYATKTGPVFGEITPTPNSGKGYTDYGSKYIMKHIKG
jgi:hypothetical protein